MKNPFVVNAILLLVALIWGLGFVPQREGMNYLSPVAFNALRFAFGALTVLPLLLLSRSISTQQIFDRKTLILGSLLGILLFGGATFQQMGIQYTTLGNVAFITSLYAIIVPIIGFFLGYRYGLIVWLGGIAATIGLYLITGASAELQLKGDILALLGAIFWAIHLLVLAKKASEFNQLVLAFYQFLFCAMFSVISAVFSQEPLLPTDSIGYFWPLLNGVIVVGVAYTLQVIIMQYAEPFSASLIFALEAVFGALAGYYIYQEQMGIAALIGAAMMLLGCVLAQMPNSQRQANQTE